LLFIQEQSPTKNRKWSQENGLQIAGVTSPISFLLLITAAAQ